MSKLKSEPLAHYIDELRLRAGFSVRGLAAAAGYKTGSGIQRYLENPDITEVKGDVARRLAGALFGKGEPPIMAGDLGRLVGLDRAEAESLSPKAVRKMLGIEVQDEEQVTQVDEYSEEGTMPLIGVASASSWMETAPSMEHTVHYLSLPFAQFVEAAGMYALKVAGDSINRIAPDGHYAICMRLGDGGAPAPDGRFVHVERHRAGFVEWTIKQAKWTKEVLTLWPVSHESRFQEPLAMGDPDDQVRILGTVIGWVRPA